MEIDDFDFKWGVKKEVGVGHTDRGLQYYESFTYKGEEYCLYDCAYFYSGGPYPSHIGKLVKLYETPAHERRVLALWLFCPMEIRRYLGNLEPKWNELFLASGQGTGLSNTNVVEAIVGKCHVVCTSKDKRNSQVSKDELEEAEFFFFRTFDVGKQTISEKFPDEIAGIKVQFLFNRIKDQNLNHLELWKPGEQVNMSSTTEPSIVAGSPAKNAIPTSRTISFSQGLEEGASIHVEHRNASENRNLKRPPPVGSQHLNCRQLQKPSEQVNLSSRIESSIGGGSPAKNVMPTSKRSSLSQDLEEGAAVLGQSRSFTIENRNLKRLVESQNLNHPELQKRSKQTNMSSKMDLSIGAGGPFKIVMPTFRKTSLSQDLEEGTSVLGASRSSAIENLNLKRSPVESQNLNRPELLKLGEQVNISSRIERSIGAGSLTKNVVPASRKNSLSKDLEEDAFVLGERRSFASNNLNSKCPPVERGTKAGREIKDMSKVRSWGDSFTENIQDTVPLKRRPNLVDGKNSSCQKGPIKVAKAIIVPQGSGARHASDRSPKASKKFTEVSRRPDAERRNWFKQLPWEERLQKAQEAGTLVLLENLDPSFSSFEIEDLVWHALNEKVAARMIQSTAFSSPFNGKAFVIFKSKLAAENAISELTRKCLILSDGRPIIGRRRNLRVSNKASSFFGHLAIDKPKVQRQSYDVRTAVSTAHCSQPNTLEYEMAIEWLELQEKSDLCWKALYKVHAEEITELKSRLML